MKEEKELNFDYLNSLDTICSDLCEAIRDLIYCIKEFKKDMDNLKK